MARARAEVEDDEEAPLLVLTDEGEHVAFAHERAVRADGECRLAAPERDQAAVEGEHRVGLVRLLRDVAMLVVVGERQPGLTFAKAGVTSRRPLASGCARGRG